MSRLDQLLKDENFLFNLDLAFIDFEQRNKNIKANKFFANLLNYKTVNEFLNHFQLDSNRYLKLDELLIILDNLGESNKMVLDYINKRYGYLCVSPVQKNQNINTFEKIFPEIANINGDLAAQYFKAIEDGKIDDEEKKQLDSILYQFRALIRGFENE